MSDIFTFFMIFYGFFNDFVVIMLSFGKHARKTLSKAFFA